MMAKGGDIIVYVVLKNGLKIMYEVRRRNAEHNVVTHSKNKNLKIIYQH